MPGPALAWPRMGESGSRGALWASQGRLPRKPLSPAFDCHCSWSAFGHSDGRVRGQWEARFQLLGRYTAGCKTQRGKGPTPQGRRPGRPSPRCEPRKGPQEEQCPAPGATVLLFSGHGRRPRPPVSHPGQPLEGAGPPRQAQGRSPGAAGASGPSLSPPRPGGGGPHLRGGGEPGGGRKPAPGPLTDCFQHSEERLAPDSGVSEASFV